MSDEREADEVADLLAKLDRMVASDGRIVWMDGVSPRTAYLDSKASSAPVAAELCRRAAEMIRALSHPAPPPPSEEI
jgi:hypothetical protein